MDEKLLKRGRVLYTIEASVEYFVSILVAGTFLATLTEYLGFDTATTGIISSFISLGCVFQLIALFVFKGRAKKSIIVLSVANQLLFTLLYVIPLLDGDMSIKGGFFISAILVAYLFYNIAHPAKINWLMSLVDDKKRGRFTATKEIVSLITGVAFTFGMSGVIDYFKEQNDLRTAFIIIAIGMLLLTVFHTFLMIFTVEKEPTEQESKTLGSIFSVLKDKNVIKVTIVFSLWYIASYSTTPFYGAYQIDTENGLGFPMWFVSISSAIYAVARASFSYVWGAYADKYSFANMIRICFAIAGVGFLLNVFCTPSNGWVVYTIHYVFYAIAMAGINNALTNLCFDYVSVDKRRDALAISLAISGLVGFLTTTAISPLVSHIEASGNMFLGLNLYAPQVTSAIAFVLTCVCIIYVSIFMVKKKKA